MEVNCRVKIYRDRTRLCGESVMSVRYVRTMAWVMGCVEVMLSQVTKTQVTGCYFRAPESNLASLCKYLPTFHYNFPGKHRDISYFCYIIAVKIFCIRISNILCFFRI